jgi:hypothetical protein
VSKTEYKTQKRVFPVKEFCHANNIAIHREFRVKCDCRKAPSNSAVKRSVDKFDMIGSVIEKETVIVTESSQRSF